MLIFRFCFGMREVQKLTLTVVPVTSMSFKFECWPTGMNTCWTESSDLLRSNYRRQGRLTAISVSM